MIVLRTGAVAVRQLRVHRSGITALRLASTSGFGIKQAYKLYGKWLIVVHGVTSAGWLALVSSAVYMGLTFDTVLSRLQKWNFISDTRAQKWIEKVEDTKPSDVARFLRIDRLIKHPEDKLFELDRKVSTNTLINIGTVLAFIKMIGPVRYATTIGVTHSIVKRLPK
ncbi:hypothetical protein ACOME3_004880 [Neoechinorhynchus agilis]